MDDQVHGFLVERGMKGFETPEIKGKLSLRASDTGEIVLRDCEVPEESRLPKAQGLKSALSCLNQLAKRRGGPAASLRRGRVCKLKSPGTNCSGACPAGVGDLPVLPAGGRRPSGRAVPGDEPA